MATKYYRIDCDGLSLAYHNELRAPQKSIARGEIVKALTWRDINTANVQSLNKQHHIRNLDTKYLEPVDKKTETMLRLLYG